jgi:PAS domain S-box-containing protein
MSETKPPAGEEDAAARRAAAELFFEHSQDLFALIDPQGGILALNPAWEVVTGFSSAELHAVPFKTFVHPDDFPALAESVRSASEGRQARVNTRFRVKDGGWRWLQGQSTRTPAGDLISVLRDVTEEHRRLLELEASRRAQLLLSESAGIGTWTYEPETGRVAWSTDIKAITGYTDEEMDTAAKFHAICDPAELQYVIDAFTDGVVTGNPRTFEHRMMTKGGRWTRWRATYQTEPRPGGVHALIGVSQNITEVAEARDHALRSEQQVRQLIEVAPYAVAMCDHSLRVLVASQRMEELFCPAGESMVGRRLDEASPKAGRRIREAQSRALTGEVLVNAEEPLTSPGGDRRWIRWEVRPWRDAAGDVGGVLTYVDDITDLVAARREAQGAARHLKVALGAAEQASEAKASFLANMSHEIRTPMNGVLGVLHLLRREALSDDGQKLLEEAVACGHMLSELLNDVLDFSKIEAGRLELSPEPAQPDEIVGGVLRLLQPQADGKALPLRFEPGLDGGWYAVDPVRLRQTLFNLVGNAVKFTESGGVTVRSFSPAPGRLRFEIADTGVGYADAAQAGLFQRFTQADASTTRRFGGSGLGLSITKRLAELMGGDVDFASAPGVGSTFWIEIEAPPAQPPLDAAAQDAPWLEGLRVLVVEDNATNRMIAAKLLENLGAAVETAENGETGVAAAARGGFDLVLMDIQMPDIDGLEATRRIRALGGPAAATPIVALTANVLSHQSQTYLAAGMNGVVGKPIVPAVLLAEIARIAGGVETDAPLAANA